jgi:hypothetical protein
VAELALAALAVAALPVEAWAVGDWAVGAWDLVMAEWGRSRVGGLDGLQPRRP